MLQFGSQIAHFLYSFTYSNCETFSKAVFLASKHPNPHMISSDIRQNTCFSNTPVVEIQVILFTFSSVVAYFSLSKCLLSQCITQSMGYITLSCCHMVCMFCTHALFPQRASQTIPASHVAQFASENKINGYCEQLRTRDSKNLIHFAAVVSSYPFMQV